MLGDLLCTHWSPSPSPPLRTRRTPTGGWLVWDRVVCEGCWMENIYNGSPQESASMGSHALSAALLVSVLSSIGTTGDSHTGGARLHSGRGLFSLSSPRKSLQICGCKGRKNTQQQVTVNVTAVKFQRLCVLWWWGQVVQDCGCGDDRRRGVSLKVCVKGQSRTPLATRSFYTWIYNTQACHVRSVWWGEWRKWVIMRHSTFVL